MKRTKSVLTGMLAFSLAISAGVTAEGESDKNKLDLGQMVVTATKTERTALDSPQSVSVITSGDIEDSMAQDVADVLSDTVGVSILSGPRNISEVPAIRGFSGSRVQLRLDGARMDFLSGHKGQLFLNIDDIERIEILKGAGSALYGSDAIGGVINIRTKSPGDILDEGENFGIGSHTSYNTVNKEIRQTGRLFGIYDKFLEYYASGTVWDSGKSIELSDGTKLNYSGTRGNDELGKIIIHPSDNSSLLFSYNRYDRDSEVPGNPASENVSNVNPLYDRNDNRQLFKTGFRYQEETGWFADLQADVYYQIYEITEDRQTGVARHDRRDLDTFGAEVKNSSRFEWDYMVNTLTYGAEYYRDKWVGRRGSAALTSFPDGTSWAVGIFAQDEIGLFDERLMIVPGIRWDAYRSETTGHPDQEEEKFTPKIAAVVKVTDDISIFGNYGSGFRAPRMDELYMTGTHFALNTFQPNPDLKPETSQNFEIGTRGKINIIDNVDLSWDSVYYLVYAEDFINTVVTITYPFGPFGPPGGTTMSRNESKVKLWGMENTVDLSLPWGFSTYVTYELERGRNTDTDKWLDSIPADKLRWGARYRTDDKSFTASLSATFANDQKRLDAPDDPDSTQPTSAYSVWDLRFSYVLPELYGGVKGLSWLEGLRFDFGIENLFDRAYREHLSTIYAPGRNYVFEISKTFKW
ncbi:MAG: TonB-dependent hemoglobin/transferrin/lactoferrin family receptor [Candidatus Omnitrophota bacterium]|nr:TonB-dependent hemoglobin/transferrin/lactoferrin family receptor [Candidatus Omnitrophota bacterium]